MSPEERDLLDWQQDRHTPIQYATGFTDEEEQTLQDCS